MKSEKDSLAVDKIISEAINNEDIGLTKCEIKEIESLEHFEELPPVGEQLDSVKDEQLPEIQKVWITLKNNLFEFNSTIQFYRKQG